jgi:hypothetical protein
VAAWAALRYLENYKRFYKTIRKTYSHLKVGIRLATLTAIDLASWPVAQKCVLCRPHACVVALVLLWQKCYLEHVAGL